MASKQDILQEVTARINHAAPHSADAAPFDAVRKPCRQGAAGTCDPSTLHLLRAGVATLLCYQIARLAAVLTIAPRAPLPIIYGVAALSTVIALALTWTPRGRRRWREMVLGTCWLTMMCAVMLGALTADPMQFLGAALLIPLGSAALTPWSPRWQLTLNAICLTSAGIALIRIPAADLGWQPWIDLAA